MSSKLVQDDIAIRINKVSNLLELEEIRLEYLGKKGLLTLEMKSLSSLSDEERKSKGRDLNSIKSFLENEILNKKNSLEKVKINEKIKKENIDITLPPRDFNTGKIHPIS